MRNFIFALMLAIAMPVFSAGAEMTNGVFYVDSPAECRLIAKNGIVTTNQLSAGKTYMVENALVELEVTNKTIFYFSGGPMIEASSKSTFSINLFDVEVKNLDSTPRRAKFGPHNLSLTFTRGEYIIVYTNKDNNSSVTIATPFTSYQLNGGKYLVRVSEKSVIAYVFDGNMQVHGDKSRIDKTNKGTLAVAIPFTDPASGVEDNIITSIKSLKPDEVEKFASPITQVEQKSDDVKFFVIGGQVVGVQLK